MKIELVMAEFGAQRINIGGNIFEGHQRLDPTLTTFTKYFDDVSLTLYTDTQVDINTDIPVNIIDVSDNPYINNHGGRYGNRCNDYYKVVGLLNSKAEYAICLDSDMYVVNDEVKTLLPLTKKFGVCIPENPRLQVRFDGIRGLDGDYDLNEDPTRGNGMATNMSPITLYTASATGKKLLEEYCNEMETHPRRGPLSMWRAIWKSGINPYMLPFQWCVCDMSVGISDVIILHTGHKKVADYYLEDG